MKKLLSFVKIVAWLIATLFVFFFEFVFFTGFVQALGDGDVANILGMPVFIGLCGAAHYLLLLLINRICYRDESICFCIFPMLGELGGLTAALIVVPIILLGLSVVVAILVHLYLTLLVFGWKRAHKTARYSSYSYTPSKPKTTTAYSTTTSTNTTPTASTTTKTTTPVKQAKPYDLDSYRRYLQSKLSASSIRVDYGYTKFVRSAKVTSINISVSGGETPSVRVTASVTLYKDNAAARSYIGVDSHNNSTYANSNVVDSEIKSALSTARASTERYLEERIRMYTRSFASENGSGPDHVHESASVSVQKA